MSLKTIGKFLFSKRHPLFFGLLICTPILGGLSHFLIQYTETLDLEKRFTLACQRGGSSLKKRERKEKHIQRYSGGKPNFLYEEIESFTPLQTEQTELEQLLTHPALKDPRQIQARLNHLRSPKNHLSFVEEAIRTHGSIKEVEEKQRYPIELNGEDLKKILCTIEDVPIASYPIFDHRPQIVITDFTLKKKKTGFGTTTFEVDMQLLKREFSK